MQGVFQHLDAAMRPDGQVLVNLGLIHRDSEWQPYWAGWLDWMRARGWRRFGLYTWDQGPGLPGDWNGRLAPAFEFVFHFNRQARQANKIVPCKWAGTPNKGSGLRAADGTISEYQHAGLPVQDFRIPDNVLRLTRHKGRGIETEHPAVFPVVLPEFLMRDLHRRGRGGVRAVRRLRHHHPGRPAHRPPRARDRAGAGLCRPGGGAVADAASRSAGDAGR